MDRSIFFFGFWEELEYLCCDIICIIWIIVSLIAIGILNRSKDYNSEEIFGKIHTTHLLQMQIIVTRTILWDHCKKKVLKILRTRQLYEYSNKNNDKNENFNSNFEKEW